MILHITNGDSAAAGIGEIHPGDTVLPWRDLLHEGPVPEGLPLEELSRLRAEYLSSAGYAPPAEVLAAFRSRDNTLLQLARFDEVALWFEHDLYDQLQLIQVLAWFHEFTEDANLTLIQADSYLGPMAAAELAPLWERRTPIGGMQLKAAGSAWSAFRASHPTLLGAMITSRFPGMPYLAPALLRFCEEYPSTVNGCSRTEQTILRLCAQSQAPDERALFRLFQQAEEPFWLGDDPFYGIVQGLQSGAEPLLRDDLSLTAKGQAVLDGTDDRIAGNGIDRWLGGVHLRGDDAAWRWEPTKRRFVPRRP